MTEIRSLTDSEREEAARRADEVFRQEGQSSMKRAYPFIFSEAEASCSFGAFADDGSLVAFMGLVPWNIRIGEATVHACSLGAVFTVPEARGQGLASRILQHIYRYMRQAGAPLLLISGDKSLYARTGCVPYGRLFRFALDRAAAESIRSREGARWTVREAREDDLYRIHGLASRRPVRYEISVRELGALIKAEGFASNRCQTHRILLAEDRGRTAAFLIVSVSDAADRPGLAIEQAGDPQAILALAVEAVLRDRLSSLDFPVPWHEDELIACLRSKGIPATEGNQSGTIRIVDGELLLEQLRPCLGANLPDDETSRLRLIEKSVQEWSFSQGDSEAWMTAQEAAMAIFDCAIPGEASLVAVAKPFPVPLPHTVGLCYI